MRPRPWAPRALPRLRVGVCLLVLYMLLDARHMRKDPMLDRLL